MASDQVIAEYARAALRTTREWHDAIRQEVTRREDEGCLIISRIETEHASGPSPQQITCWRTGLQFGIFDGTPESWSAAEAAAGQPLWDIDAITMQADEDNPPLPPGLPASLAGAVRDWLGSDSTPVEDMAELTGLEPDEILRCQAFPAPEDTPPGGTAQPPAGNCRRR